MDGWSIDSSDSGTEGWDIHGVWAAALGSWLLVALLVASGGL